MIKDKTDAMAGQVHGPCGAMLPRSTIVRYEYSKPYSKPLYSEYELEERARQSPIIRVSHVRTVPYLRMHAPAYGTKYYILYIFSGAATTYRKPR
jgi:hypothetical protein